MISIHLQLPLTAIASGLVQKDPPDTQISANYRALPNILLTNFRPPVKKTKQMMEQKKRKFRALLGAQ